MIEVSRFDITKVINDAVARLGVTKRAIFEKAGLHYTNADKWRGDRSPNRKSEDAIIDAINRIEQEAAMAAMKKTTTTKSTKLPPVTNASRKKPLSAASKKAAKPTAKAKPKASVKLVAKGAAAKKVTAKRK